MKNISYLPIVLCVLFIFTAKASDCDFMQPDNPDALVLASIYHSSFAGYHSFQKFKLQSWREANDKAAQSTHSMGHMNMRDMNMNMKAPTPGNPNTPDQSLQMKH